MVGTESSYPEMADGGEDVSFDLPPVPIPSGLGQVDLLPWQPLASEVGAEGERPHLVVAAVQLGCQPGRELFSFLPGSSGGMPAPFLFTGDRVQPFVHHRVPAVTLTGHIPSHEVLLPWVSDLRKPGRRIGRNTPTCRGGSRCSDPHVENLLVRTLQGSPCMRRDSGRTRRGLDWSSLDRWLEESVDGKGVVAGEIQEVLSRHLRGSRGAVVGHRASSFLYAYCLRPAKPRVTRRTKPAVCRGRFRDTVAGRQDGSRVRRFDAV
jgi:hypothetical protein